MSRIERPVQYGRTDLQQMTTDEINQARREGRLRDLAAGNDPDGAEMAHHRLCRDPQPRRVNPRRDTVRLGDAAHYECETCGATSESEYYPDDREERNRGA